MDPTPPTAPPLRLKPFEIILHGLTHCLGLYALVGSFWPLGKPADLLTAGLALLPILLSVAVMLSRFGPEIPLLRWLELGLSGLAVAVGGCGAAVTLVFMASGALYRGPSPDAGGMAVMVGFLLYYPMAALGVLLFLLNASRLSPRVRRWLVLASFGLVLLPICLLVGLGPAPP